MAKTRRTTKIVYVQLPATTAAVGGDGATVAPASPPPAAVESFDHLPKIMSVEEYEKAQQAYSEYRKGRKAALKKRFGDTIKRAQKKLIEIDEMKKTIKPRTVSIRC